MNAEESKTEIFDVFLCHNSEDKPAIRVISQELSQKKIKPWLDEQDIKSGAFWDAAIEQQIETVKAAAVFIGQHGVGPWQRREIIALLDEFDKRGCPVIPVILESAPVDINLPWSLKGLNWVDFRATNSHPLERLIWGITGQKPAELSNFPDSDKPATTQDADRRPLVASAETKKLRFDDRESSKARRYPPLDKSPEQDQAAQLEILRLKVKEYWVEGVLRHSLYDDVLISLRKVDVDKAVDAPWKYPVELSDAVNSPSLENRDISAIYDATGLLLILGEPGAGKTTTLLDLTRTLLERAGKDIKERVPVVLNLSSWKERQKKEKKQKEKRLAEWISAELSEKYRVPKKIAGYWLEQNYLLPLLDGLDEVETSMQPDCVAAINEFIEESNPSGLVVCCRLNEYRWLPERLKLNGAICLEALSKDEVTGYFTKAGPQLAVFREAVNTDPVLQELAQTPLMLSIMSLAFQGAGTSELALQKGGSPQERRKQIFRLYVEQMFRRKGTASLLFPKEKTIGWLSWVAKMRENSQSVFLIEGLQPTWLGTRAARAAYGAVTALALGLIPALIFALIFAPTRSAIFGLIFGPIFGLIFGLFAGGGAGSLDDIALVETTSWDWNQFWKRTIPGSVFGLLLGLIVGLILGMVDGLIWGLILGLTFGLVSGFVGGFIEWLNRVLDAVRSDGWDWYEEPKLNRLDKASPNQGIKLSLKSSLAPFLLTWLTVGLIFGIVFKLIGGLSVGLSVGLGVGLISGLIAGLNRGGSAVIRHYALRLMLWLKGYTPFNFVKFLDHCTKLILLKKVGGGYIFIHRMLLDYFADLPPQDKSLKQQE